MRRTIRIGLGRGKGMGYKNILPGHDKRVHRESGEGRKQPQRIPYSAFVVLPKKIKGTKPYEVAVAVAEMYASSPDLTKEQKDKYIAETFKHIGGEMKKTTPLEAEAKTKTDEELMEIAKTETREPQIQAVVNELSRRERKQSMMSDKFGNRVEDTKAWQYLAKLTPDDLDPFERSQYEANRKRGMGHTEALQLIINGVEGDHSQLSEHLFVVAENEDKEMNEAHDLVKGGLGDNRPDSAFDPKELAKGEKVEREHTSNPAIAKEIVKDHLTEFPKGYYEGLAKLEKNLKKENQTIILEKPIGSGHTDWKYATILVDKGEVELGEGHSPYLGHEETRILRRIKPKDLQSYIKKLKEEGYAE
jgi:hypothetical protein